MSEKEKIKNMKTVIMKNYKEYDIEIDNEKYKVKLLLGNYTCTYTISKCITPKDNSDRLLEIINNNFDVYTFSLTDDVLSVKTSVWVDRKPTAKGVEEILKMSVANLNCVQMILERT